MDLVTTEQATTDSPIPHWREVYDTINGGAFAVLLTSAIVGAWLWRVASKPVTKYIEAQIENSKKLQETIASNSDTLKTMAVNNVEVVQVLAELKTRQDRIELAVTTMGKGIPVIATRQRQQIEILTHMAKQIDISVQKIDVGE